MCGKGLRFPHWLLITGAVENRKNPTILYRLACLVGRWLAAAVIAGQARTNRREQAPALPRFGHFQQWPELQPALRLPVWDNIYLLAKNANKDYDIYVILGSVFLLVCEICGAGDTSGDNYEKVRSMYCAGVPGFALFGRLQENCG